MMRRFVLPSSINAGEIVPALRFDFVLLTGIHRVGSALGNRGKGWSDQSIPVSAVVAEVQGGFCSKGNGGVATLKEQSKQALQARVAALMRKLVCRARESDCGGGGAVYGSLPEFGSCSMERRRHPQMGVYGDAAAMAALCGFVYGLMQRIMQDGLTFAAQERWFTTRSDEKRKRD